MMNHFNQYSAMTFNFLLHCEVEDDILHDPSNFDDNPNLVYLHNVCVYMFQECSKKGSLTFGVFSY
jgi:hypothetical protein